jgi:hypothetical protein
VGVLRYDRKTQAVHKYELPDAVCGLTVSGNRTLAPMSSRIAVIDGDKVSRYFVDRDTDWRLRIAEVIR